VGQELEPEQNQCFQRCAPENTAAYVQLPFGQHSNNLGQIGRGDTVPEFERALFRFGASGILRKLVKSDFMSRRST
jgi:hypothetical protein